MLPLLSIQHLTNFVRSCRANGLLPSCVPCLHAYARLNGLVTHGSLGNLLVSILVDVGLTHSARDVFERLPYSEDSSCNDLINGYVKAGELQQALLLYHELSAKPLKLCSYTYVALFKACTILQDLQTGTEIHARAGPLEYNRFVATSLIDMYSKCGMLDKSQDVFDRLTVRDVTAWNALIAGYSQHGFGEKALNVFEKMQAQGFSADSVTFACSLKACGIIGNEQKGAEIHAETTKLGLLRNNIILGNAVVDMYAKCGSFAKAKEAFHEISSPNVITWTALLSGFALHDRGHEAIECFERMADNGIVPDAATFVSSLKACGSIKAIQKGIALHAEIERKGTFNTNVIVGNALVDMYVKCGLFDNAWEVFDTLSVRDVVSWTALVSGYIQHDYGEEALALFDQMLSEAVVPNDITVACALKACGSVGAVWKGNELHAYLEQEDMLKTNQLVCNTLVDMYAKLGMLRKACEVFNKIFARDIISWTALLTGYAQLGKVEHVFNLYNALCKEMVKPTSVTCISILNACSHAGLIEEGLKFYNDMMREYEIHPTVEHDTCIIDLLCRSGQLKKALAVITEVCSHQNSGLWLTMLGACQKCGDVNLGYQAFQQVVALDNRDKSAYVLMCNIYANAGMHEDVRSVEQMGLVFSGLEIFMPVSME